MKKGATILSVTSLIALIALVIFLGELEWKFSSIIVSAFLIFLCFIHSFTIAISKEGLLRNILAGLFGVQIVLGILLVSGIIQLHLLWFWEVSIALIGISIGIISINVKHKVSPLLYYLQYLILAIVVFSLIGLGITSLSLQVVSIGFIAICLLSSYVLLFTQEKKA